MAQILKFPDRQEPSERTLEGIEMMRQLIASFNVGSASLTPIETCRFVLVAALGELEPEYRVEMAAELRRVASALLLAHRQQMRINNSGP